MHLLIPKIICLVGVAKPLGCVHAVEGSNPNRDVLFTCKDRTMYEFVENSSRRAVNEIN